MATNPLGPLPKTTIHFAFVLSVFASAAGLTLKTAGTLVVKPSVESVKVQSSAGSFSGSVTSRTT